MKFYLGIDGGGSKTRFALCDENGHLIAEYTTTGASYRELGVERVCVLLKEGVERVLDGRREGVVGVCFGMPCYGENMAEDLKAVQRIREALAPLPVMVENDVAAAWAGALAFESGIIILAGTGSMALGRDNHGIIQRAGGWSEFFSDEGSCYWLGKRTLELFGKQSDGRLPRGPLYEIVRKHFSLEDDFDIVGITEAQIMPSRRSVAALQLLLEKAAQKGDDSALRLYAEAAEELAMMVKGLRARMTLTSGSPVSYSGGLFNAGALILTPLMEELQDLDMRFTPPRLLPVDGAILFVVEAFEQTAMARVIQGLMMERNRLGG